MTSPLPDILFEAECTKLLAAASQDTRTYLLVLMLLETGMKTEELMDLQLSHIDTSNKYAPEVWVKHTGKRVKKDRKLKLPREVVPTLSEYVETYTITDRLFPYTQRMLRYLLTSAGDRAGISEFRDGAAGVAAGGGRAGGSGQPARSGAGAAAGLFPHPRRARSRQDHRVAGAKLSRHA